MVENTTIVIYPAADVYAFSGYGTRYSRSQLKFDVSSIPSGSNISSARLCLYRFAADNWDGDITVYRVDDQFWGENITSIEFDAQTLTDGENHAGKFMSPGWDNLDVLSQLKVDFNAAHTFTSFRLRWANDDGSEPSVGIDDGRFLAIESELDELCIVFPSSECSGSDPHLEVTYATTAPPQLPTQPQLSSPSNGSEVSTKTPTLKWENGMYAENHRVLLDDDSNPDDNPLYNQTIIGDNKWTTPSLTEDETYYWKVIAQNENGENHSVTWHFTVNAEKPPTQPPPSPPPSDTTPPPTPLLISPTNGANITDNTPPLDWSDVSDPSGVTYDVSIAGDAGFVSIVLQKTGLTASAYELTSAEALAAGTYYWRARAVDGAGNVGSWSENWSFTVSIAPPPPGDSTPPPTPSLISPADGVNITDNTPPLDWSDVSDPSGVTYDVSIAGDAGFVSIVLQKTGLTASTYELTQAEALVAGTYYWRVRAVDGAGNVGSWSDDWSFTVSAAPSPPVSVEIPLITAIALLVVAMIAAIALYLIKRRKRHISGPRHGVLRRARR